MTDVMGIRSTSMGLEIANHLTPVTALKCSARGTVVPALRGSAKADCYSMEDTRRDAIRATSAESKYAVPEGFKNCTVEVQGGGDACFGAAGSGGAAGTSCR